MDQNEKTVAQNATISGNAAALRSALEDTQDLLKHFTRNGGMLANAFALHMRDNDAALAAPARNCDYWEHWEEAWAYFCPKYCKKINDDGNRAWLFIRWLFDKAEKKGGVQ